MFWKIRYVRACTSRWWILIIVNGCSAVKKKSWISGKSLPSNHRGGGVWQRSPVYLWLKGLKDWYRRSQVSVCRPHLKSVRAAGCSCPSSGRWFWGSAWRRRWIRRAVASSPGPSPWSWAGRFPSRGRSACSPDKQKAAFKLYCVEVP